MHVRAMAVMSVDGIIKPSRKNFVLWKSEEDKQQFSKIKAESDVIILGRKTFDEIKSSIDKNDNKLRVVYSKKNKKENLNDFLEFTSEDPRKLLSNLKTKGFKNILIAGGREIYSMFINYGLVDELILTIEPVMLGDGVTFLDDKLTLKKLTLISSTILNTKGTLLNRYKVENNITNPSL